MGTSGVTWSTTIFFARASGVRFLLMTYEELNRRGRKREPPPHTLSRARNCSFIFVIRVRCSPCRYNVRTSSNSARKVEGRPTNEVTLKFPYVTSGKRTTSVSAERASYRQLSRKFLNPSNPPLLDELFSFCVTVGFV